MTERARDPRSIRTVAALQTALRGLVRDRPLDTISVSELCRLAGVRRTTYYTHFDGIADQLTSMLIEPTRSALAVQEPRADVAATGRAFRQGVIAALVLTAGDRPLFRTAFESAGSAPFRHALTMMIAETVETALDVWAALDVATEVDRRTAVPFIAGGVALVLESWVVTDELDAEAWEARLFQHLPPWWPRDDREGALE